MVRDPANKEKKLWIKEDVVVRQIKEVSKSFQLPEDLLSDVLDYIKRTHESEKELNQISVKELRSENDAINQKLNRLTDLLIEGDIEKKVYQEKHKELAFRRDEINCILSDRNMADDSFKDALCNILTITSKSADLFESSNTDQKRNLIGFVFSNLKLEGPTLRYTLKKPFGIFAKLPNNPEWRPLRDSNPCYRRERGRMWRIRIKIDSDKSL
jgi:hypothetical protein